MHEHRTPDGKTIYYMSRADLERLPGHKGHGDTYRSRCPVHGGDSFQAFTIDYATGWGHCFKCGDAWSLRVTDHPETKLPKDHPDYRPADHKRNTPPPTLESLAAARNARKPQTPPRNAPGSPQAVDSPQNDPVPMNDARKRLQAQIPAAMDALPGSPGAAYLEARGIGLETARALQIGWSTRGDLANRVILPLSGPDGIPTGATGRAIRDGHNPKYKALATGKGYQKHLFNGGAISHAKRTGHPLLIVEGPLDAAAAYAAGYPLTVALGSTSYRHWDHFAGVHRAILLLDNDPAGIDARGRAYTALQEYIDDVRVFTPAALQTILEGAGDLGDYWQRYRRMPPIIAAMMIGPHRHAAGPLPPQIRVLQNDNPMVEGIPHGSPRDGGKPSVEDSPAQNDTPMQSGIPHAIELTGPAVLELFETLPPALQVEAVELAHRLETDRDFGKELRADFYAGYSTLAAADRVAVLWALIYRPRDLQATRTRLGMERHPAA